MRESVGNSSLQFVKTENEPMTVEDDRFKELEGKKKNRGRIEYRKEASIEVECTT